MANKRVTEWLVTDRLTDRSTDLMVLDWISIWLSHRLTEKLTDPVVLDWLSDWLIDLLSYW